MANPWAMPWQGKYKGKVAILDDYRESISLGLMKNGIFDLNTTDPAQITKSQQDSLQNLAQLTNVHIDNNDYTEVPSGQIWIHHAWSGDMAAAAQYMPKGVPVDVVGYWFPTDGKGPVANDTNTVLRGAQNPVLAHLFLNYMDDLPNVADEHQLQRLHAADQRRHAAAPGQRRHPAAEPDLHRGPAVVLPARASASCSCPSRPTSSGSRPGRPSATASEAGIQVTAGGGLARRRSRPRREALTGSSGRPLAAPGHHLAGPAVHRARSTSCWRSRPGS